MDLYIITGITGYLGSLFTRTILKEKNVYVAGIVRSTEKVDTIFLPEEQQRIRFINMDVTARNFIDIFPELRRLSEDFNRVFILHFAAITRSLQMIEQPVETADSIVLGTRNILEAARLLRPVSVLYASSMEVYGELEGGKDRSDELSLGYINMNNSRSCYPMAKRMAENYCYDYFSEYGVRVKIARLAQTFGTGVLPGENRVFAQIARAVFRKNDIVLSTDGSNMGNYIDAEDAVKAMRFILYRGRPGETYNVVNEELTMTIKEMADYVCKEIGGGLIKVQFNNSSSVKAQYASKTSLRMSGAKLSRLGFNPEHDMKYMYNEMIKYMILHDII